MRLRNLGVILAIYLFFPLVFEKENTLFDALFSHSPPCQFSEQIAPAHGFKNGVNFGNYDGIDLLSKESLQSLRNAKNTRINWLAIVVTGFQDSAQDTQIFTLSQLTPAPDELAAFIQEVKKLNLRIMLKFHINLLNDVKQWSGNVGKGFGEKQWQKWFASYEDFLNPYLTKEILSNVDIICIGNELTMTEGKNNNWRKLIARVRTNFSGSLVYGANWWPGAQNINWWDALDYIGISAYRGLAKDKPFSIENLVKAWQAGPDLAALKKLSVKYKKPVILTEVGYRSIRGANIQPYDYAPKSNKDEKNNSLEQANLYYALYKIARSLPWLEGIFWWEWDANPRRGGIHDKDYTPYGKLTENLIPLFSCIK